MSPPKNSNQTTEDAKVVDQTNTENITKSRTPSGGSSSNDGETSCSSASGSSEEVEKLTEEFPYGPAFRAAMGRVTAFPDGTEAVMIDSAMALEAFRIDQMVIIAYFFNTHIFLPALKKRPSRDRLLKKLYVRTSLF